MMKSSHKLSKFYKIHKKKLKKLVMCKKALYSFSKQATNDTSTMFIYIQVPGSKQKLLIEVFTES